MSSTDLSLFTYFREKNKDTLYYYTFYIVQKWESLGKAQVETVSLKWLSLM